MSADEVSEIIGREVAERWDDAFPHGITLRRCLVSPPRIGRFVDPEDSPEAFELWIVLEERPETHDGYQIVFDGRDFGLASSGNVFLGYYGTLLETLNAI